MKNTVKTPLIWSVVALIVSGGLALGMSPTAFASAHASPKPMNISATGGDKTAVDSDGTQGSFTDAVQGVEDSDGDQDAFDLKKSEEATPQDKAENKMTK
jgi:hypothetical protein